MAEARVAGGLQHPNVVTLHDVLTRTGSSILVLEHLPGGTLEERLREGGRIGPEEAIRIVADLLRGLEAVHAKGIVHRDLKPANVLLTENGTPKIADFGIARPTTGATAAGDTVEAPVGTPADMAPEQRAGSATSRSDLYAIGVILRDALRPPVTAELARVLHDEDAPADAIAASTTAGRIRDPHVVELREAVARRGATVLVYLPPAGGKPWRMSSAPAAAFPLRKPSGSRRESSSRSRRPTRAASSTAESAPGTEVTAPI